MKKIFRIIFDVVINNLKFIIIKLFHFKNFRYNPVNIISPLCNIDIQNKGKIIIGKKCNILSRNILGVRESGTLEIKDGVFINNNCHIISHKSIEIGKNVCIGPNTIIMDHDHVFVKDKGVDKKSFVKEDIVIEDNVWIGANCVILKGVKIGKNSVVAAGSIVYDDVPSNTVLVQKRNNNYKEI